MLNALRGAPEWMLVQGRATSLLALFTYWLFYTREGDSVSLAYLSENFLMLMLEPSTSTVLARLVSKRVEWLYAATTLTALMTRGFVSVLYDVRRVGGSLGGCSGVQHPQLDCAAVGTRPLFKDTFRTCAIKAPLRSSNGYPLLVYWPSLVPSRGRACLGKPFASQWGRGALPSSMVA
ncbi:MAG: hypothetical protein DRK00_07220 [Thermoprotei archaeon]|nr:MAG: hypothetical protein DRK00_07220 [Thermoprotei archaeon]